MLLLNAHIILIVCCIECYEFIKFRRRKTKSHLDSQNQLVSCRNRPLTTNVIIRQKRCRDASHACSISRCERQKMISFPCVYSLSVQCLLTFSHLFSVSSSVSVFTGQSGYSMCSLTFFVSVYQLTGLL